MFFLWFFTKVILQNTPCDQLFLPLTTSTFKVQKSFHKKISPWFKICLKIKNSLWYFSFFSFYLSHCENWKLACLITRFFFQKLVEGESLLIWSVVPVVWSFSLYTTIQFFFFFSVFCHENLQMNLYVVFWVNVAF